MKKIEHKPILTSIIKKMAPKIGAKVLIEPEWGIVGQITYKNGKRRYFRYSTIDINTVGASDIAKDKDYANFFMKKMGYPTISGKTFFSNNWAKAIGSKRDIHAAYRYAKTIGFPVIVKPNSGSQGVGVSLVHTRKQFFRSMKFIFERDRVALVQKPMPGKDYRIVALDGNIISAYERIPLNVIGDGKSTIRKLLKAKQIKFIDSSRDTKIRIDDFRIEEKLRSQKLNFLSIPDKGKQVFLLDNANLSTGGDSVDVTNKLHNSFHHMAKNLTRDMGLRLCGVDILVEGLIDETIKSYWILEVNAAPGLDHYARSGKAQERIVEKLYLRVLKNMSH